MKAPVAFPIEPNGSVTEDTRRPQAFTPDEIADVPQSVETISDAGVDETVALAPPRKRSWPARLLIGTASLLVSLGIGLAIDSLIRNLFANNPWLGWLGLTVLGLFILALLAVIVREAASLRRLRTLDHLKLRAAEAIQTDRLKDAQPVLRELQDLYASRPDLARSLQVFGAGQPQVFDGGELVRFGERTLMAPLDARARALTAASARRVALVTAVSPRALVDIAYVVWESVRLGGAIARLYGARPGLLGTWKLLGAILGHLAVTGGLVLTDGLVEQLVGQGLAAKLSQRLGEGVVNGLMTVRVGIAAMRVVRPLPFVTEAQPLVRDFLPELTKVVRGQDAAR